MGFPGRQPPHEPWGDPVEKGKVFWGQLGGLVPPVPSLTEPLELRHTHEGVSGLTPPAAWPLARKAWSVAKGLPSRPCLFAQGSLFLF